MADTIFQILQWAIPSGGIGAAIAWIAEKKTRDAKTAKEVHDTYKAMYEDISALLVETQKKYEETKEQIETAFSLLPSSKGTTGGGNGVGLYSVHQLLEREQIEHRFFATAEGMCFEMNFKEKA